MTLRFLLSATLLTAAAFGVADQGIYSDELDSSWQSWSWASVNFSNTSPVHSGSDSIAVTQTASYQALYLHHDPQSARGYQAIVFWVNGGSTGGQSLAVQGTLNGSPQLAYPLPPLAANTWTRVTVPLKALGVWGAADFDGFWLQDVSGNVESTFYVDDASLESVPTTNPDPLYVDSLEAGWTNQSSASVNFSNLSPVFEGQDSISVTETKAHDALALNHAPLDGTLYSTLTFWINGGASGGQTLQLEGTLAGVAQTGVSLPPLVANTWQQVSVPLTALGVQYRGDFDGFLIQGTAGHAQPVYYVDSITLDTVPVSNPVAQITVNFSNQTPISPLIYGINPPSTQGTNWGGLGTGFTFARMGGNRLTAYNWENNASNAGSDYEYENDGLMGETDEPGWAQRTFIQSVIGSSAIPLVTIPMAGYVSADKAPPGDVRNSPNYLQTRFRISLPSKPGGQYVYPPDVTDAYVYQDECVNYLKQFAQIGYPIYFELDNEPDLWDSTHAEIHPNPVTYAELMSDTIAYATSIKSVYPSTTIFGPVNYGFLGFVNLQNAPDANGRDFLTFYLQGIAQAASAAGKRLVDVLDLHWYPEATGDGFRITNEGDSPGLSDARIQAPRSLWDPAYIENSWITGYLGNQAIDLIPGVETKINNNYPGTKLAFTEYNYGGNNAISGAIAQADVLGIFGRYGVFAASNWGINSSMAAQVAGFNAFINFDGNGAKFGNTELGVVGENPAENSVYAATDSTSLPGRRPLGPIGVGHTTRMTLVVINKTLATTPFQIQTVGFNPLLGSAYAIVDGPFGFPTAQDVYHFGNLVFYNAPPQSVTTIVLTSAVSR